MDKKKIKKATIFILGSVIYSIVLYTVSVYAVSSFNLLDWGPYQKSTLFVLFFISILVAIKFPHVIFSGFSKNWIDIVLFGNIIWFLILKLLIFPNLEQFQFPFEVYIIALVSLILFLLRIIFHLVDIKKKNKFVYAHNTLLIDEPISLIHEDRFNRLKIALNMAEVCLNNKFENGFVVGVQGSWGFGKSSFLGLVKDILIGDSKIDKLEEGIYQKIKKIRNETLDKNIRILDFDPWYFNSKDELLEQFFWLIKNELNSFIPLSKKNELNILFSRYITPQLSVEVQPEIRIPGFSIRTNKFSTNNEENLIILQRKIKSFLQNYDYRLIVFIDNLDRIETKEFLLMLKLVRLCSNFPGFIFILTFDQKQVEEIFEKENLDPIFLEKIIQTTVDLPKISADEIDNVFYAELNNFYLEHKIKLPSDFYNKFSNVYQKYISGFLLSDLRTTKKYLNAIQFSLPTIKTEINYFDFFILEFIRLFFPKEYLELYKYQDDLIVTFGLGFETLNEKRKIRLKELTDYIEKNNIIDNRYLIVTGLIDSLFPLYKAFSENKEKPNFQYYENYNLEENRNQNICSPLHFNKYFSLHVPQKEITKDKINQIIELFNGSESTLESELTKNILIKSQSEEKLEQLVQKLNLYVDEFNEIGKVKIIKELSSITDKFVWKRQTNFMNNFPRTAILFILDCLQAINDIKKIQTIIIDILLITPSLPFACYFIKIIFNDVSYNFKPSKDLEFDKIKNTLLERIRESVVMKDINIFEDYPDNFYYILTAWKDDKVLDSNSDADKYVYGILKKNPKYIPRLLANEVTYTPGTQNPVKFNYTDLYDLYDVDLLFDIIQNAKISEGFSEDETFALEEFKTGYKINKNK